MDERREQNRLLGSGKEPFLTIASDGTAIALRSPLTGLGGTAAVAVPREMHSEWPPLSLPSDFSP